MASNKKIYVLQIEDKRVGVTFPQDAFMTWEAAVQEMKDYLNRHKKLRPSEVYYVSECQNYGWMGHENDPINPRQVIRVIPTCLWS